MKRLVAVGRITNGDVQIEAPELVVVAPRPASEQVDPTEEYYRGRLAYLQAMEEAGVPFALIEGVLRD